jgi:hypothetical protein
MTDETPRPPFFVLDAQDNLRKLAVNIIRVVRGAGEPHNIVAQSVNFLAAVKESYDAGTPVALSAMTEVLRRGPPPGDEFERATDLIINASLRVAAARLAGSDLQHSAGMNDLFGAIRMMEDIRAANRKAFQ